MGILTTGDNTVLGSGNSDSDTTVLESPDSDSDIAGELSF